MNEEIAVKFYYTNYGCMGHIGNGQYKLFATVSEYYEWLREATNGD